MNENLKEYSTDDSSNMFQLTVNNPESLGITYEKIKDIMTTYIHQKFYCMSTEVGLKSNTPHIHIFILLWKMERFSKIKKNFPYAHIEGRLKGSVQENIEYVQKSGKWRYLEKGTTQVEGTYFQSSEQMPYSNSYQSKGNNHSTDDSLLRFLSSFSTIILFKEDITKENAIGKVVTKNDLVRFLLSSNEDIEKE